MKALLAHLLRLFVDSAWLAGGALLCVLACAALRRLGGPPALAGVLLLSTLVTTLGISIRLAFTKD